MKQNRLFTEVLPVLLFTLLGFAIMGYHPGYEDDGIYLAAVQSDVHPALFPHDAAFFKLQMQASAFDSATAEFVRITHIPVSWTELLGQLLAIFLILWACQSIAKKFFDRAEVRWAGVAMMAAMLTLPVAGTALYIADQHLHPRNLATAFILLATDRVLAGKRWHAIPLLVAAFVMHPIMAAFGFSFCFCLALALMEPVYVWLRDMRASIARGAAVAVPIGWLFEAPNPAWRKALDTRHYYLLSGWQWYEWLGALGPLVLFWLLMRLAKKRGEMLLSRFAFAVLVYGIFQQVVAMVMLTPPSLVRLSPLQPMRYLQIIYCFLALLAGCLTAQYLLKGRVWRWAIFLLAINGGMLSAQESEFPECPHFEMPWTRPANPWLQAFAWIRENTPADAYFALDPYYLALPDEDYHSFRALAERSQLADGIKDTAVVVLVPQLAPEWSREVRAQTGWDHFTLADFERLKRKFGVGWVLVRYPAPAGLNCRWHNEQLSVCQVP
ncbi:MAG TPA: hypothetical protein VGR47_17060 [Terracidiphilus sp.]|nr:hypothetical protein [Terracidiphilus sp.]